MPEHHLCKNTRCKSWKTVTHYFHTKDGTPHHFEVANPEPPPNPETTVPRPQPCPIDGCPMMARPPSGHPVFSYCLDCGKVETHKKGA